MEPLPADRSPLPVFEVSSGLPLAAVLAYTL